MTEEQREHIIEGLMRAFDEACQKGETGEMAHMAMTILQVANANTFSCYMPRQKGNAA